MGVRIGIDVGGTFTKAAVVDTITGELMGKATVPTSHHAREGVAHGVVDVFREGLARAGVGTGLVELVVLSTTQAVNALLEGDVAPVGVVGLSRTSQQRDAFKRTQVGPVKLSLERDLPVYHAFLTTEDLDAAAVEGAIEDLVDRGARSIVASAAYAVEDPEPEREVLEAARRLGVPATAGHEMSGLYGLEVRTLTAAVNASILPKMAKTIEWVESSMRLAGLEAPLMVMHGDLEVAALEEARRRPATTILSGPAASVAGALLYHKVLDGLFMEVGGTSTNVGVVKAGRPVTKYARIMDHPTALRSVDVRVGGVAGGSMARLRSRRIADVGPRSAHIAGLPYPSYQPPKALRDLRLVMLAPREDDPADYAAVENDRGERFALTLTDAANALGLVPERDHARGCRESARLALEPLAAHLRVSVDQAAAAMLDLAVDKLLPVMKDLMSEYGLARPPLVGLGGGASVLVPRVADKMRCSHEVVPHAEVISSIGVAMAPVGVELERSLPDNDSEALAAYIREAEDAAVRAGAERQSLRVTVEPIPERSAVRLRAVGATVGTSRSGWGEVDESTARSLAAKALRLPGNSLSLVFESRDYRVFEGVRTGGFGPFRRSRRSLALVDREGAVRFAARDGVWAIGSAEEASSRIEVLAPSRRGLLATPAHLAFVYGPHMVDLPKGFSGSVGQVARSLSGASSREPVVILVGSAQAVG